MKHQISLSMSIDLLLTATNIATISALNRQIAHLWANLARKEQWTRDALDAAVAEEVGLSGITIKRRRLKMIQMIQEDT